MIQKKEFQRHIFFALPPASSCQRICLLNSSALQQPPQRRQVADQINSTLFYFLCPTTPGGTDIMRTAGPPTLLVYHRRCPFLRRSSFHLRAEGKRRRSFPRASTSPSLFRSCAAHAPRKTRTSSIEFSVWAFARICPLVAKSIRATHSNFLLDRRGFTYVRFAAEEGNNIGVL